VFSEKRIKDDADMFDRETDEEFFRNICCRIGEIRRKKGLTQEQLGIVADAATKEVQRWETMAGLSLRTLRKLSLALECHIGEFFKKPRRKRPGPGRPRKYENRQKDY